MHFSCSELAFRSSTCVGKSNLYITIRSTGKTRQTRQTCFVIYTTQCNSNAKLDISKGSGLFDKATPVKIYTQYSFWFGLARGNSKRCSTGQVQELTQLLSNDKVPVLASQIIFALGVVPKTKHNLERQDRTCKTTFTS